MAVKRISALFFILLFMSSISSCGRTGKLYLPDEKPPSEAKVSANTIGHLQVSPHIYKS